MDNQNQQEERKKGAVDYINDTRRILGSIKRTSSSLRTLNVTVKTVTQLVTKPFPWVWIVVIIILLIVIFQLFFGGGSGLSFDPGDSQANLPGLSGPGSISSCTFYRGGDPVPGVQIGNSEMEQFVNSASAKIGVPAAVVAGIMRVESGGRLASTDLSYFTSDYDSDCSRDGDGNCIAYGLMQFTPGTFRSTFQANLAELNSIFGKTDVRAEIDSRNNMYPNNYLRIYSIRDSIIATAFKVKNDKQSINGDGPWDRDTIYEIARRYYGCLLYTSCSSGPYSYGGDVWKSYSECKTLPSGNISITCPLDPVGNSAHISCGTASNPVNLCEHGGTGYPACTAPPYPGCPYSPQLLKAIDVVAGNGLGANIPVYLPYVKGTSVGWSFVRNEYLNANWGSKQVYQADVDRQTIIIELVHLNESNPPQQGPLFSGAKVGTTHSVAAHLHVGVVINGVPVDPISDLFMCTGQR